MKQKTNHSQLGIYGFFLLSLLYLGRFFLLVSAENGLTHDNYSYHFPGFIYFANSLAHGFGIPKIMLEWGGSDIGMSAISMGYLAPHRWIGYACYALFSLNIFDSYLISLALGFVLNAFAWYLVWQRAFSSTISSLFCTALLLFGGMGITILHQEQILFTLAYLPWMILVGLRARENASFFPLTLALFGSMLTLHYPQIHLVTFFLFFLLLALLKKEIFFKKIYFFNRTTKVTAMLLGVLAVSPSVYTFLHQENYASPERKTSNIFIGDWREYEDINIQMDSSASIHYFKNIPAVVSGASDDQYLFYLGYIGLFFLILGMIVIIVSERSWAWLPILMEILFLLSLGVNCVLPKIFFYMHFPLISAFRQWYHFSPVLMLAAISVAGVGLRYLNDFIVVHSRRKYLFFTYFLLLALIIFPSNKYFSNYVSTFLMRVPYHTTRWSREEFLLTLKNRTLTVPRIGSAFPLLAQKENIDFWARCPKLSKGLFWEVKQVSLTPKFPDTFCANIDPNDSPNNIITPAGVTVASPNTLVGINQTFLMGRNSLNFNRYHLSVLSMFDPAVQLVHNFRSCFIYFFYLQIASVFIGILFLLL